MGYYPILINLEGQRAVVIGGGRVAERKIETLLEHGATVHVIAKELTPKLLNYVSAEKISHLSPDFEDRHLSGAFLVVAATDDAALNRRVSEVARKKGLLVNAVDQPSDCNFIVPSILRRGDLVVSVSTSGKSPALARRIREKLEGIFGREYESLLILMGRLRKEILSRGLSSDHNRELFQELVDSDILAQIKEGDLDKVAEILSRILDRHVSSRDVHDYLKAE